MITPAKTIQHAKYLGSQDDEGYATSDHFEDPPVNRPAYGWYPGQGSGGAAMSASKTGGEEYERRVISYRMVQVPDTSPYSVRDKVILDGVAYFVAGDVMDYTTGPFGFKPGGEVFVQRVVG